MKIIALPKGKGKTTQAIDLANQTGAYLVFRSQDLASHLRKTKNIKRFPMSYEELLKHSSRSFVKNVVIDDADAFIAHVLARTGFYAEGITITVNQE